MLQLSSFYGGCCDHNIEEVRPFIKLSALDDVTQEIIKNIFAGKLQSGQLPVNYYLTVASKLTEAVKRGLKVKDLELGSPAAKMFEKFRDNVFAFSSAKSFEMMRQYSSNLKDEKGELRSFGDFRNRCIPIGEVFNDNHLKSEYNMAVAKTQMAAKWDNLQKYSMLQFRTVGDGHVRKQHQALDGLTLPRDHSFWRSNWPPLDWGCRCTVIPADGRSEYTPPKANEMEMKIPAYFKGNSGIEHIAFKEDHPLFVRMKSSLKGSLTKESELTAVRNYAMPSAENIVDDPKLPDLSFAESKEAARDTYDKSSKNFKTKDGITINSDRWDHIMRKEDEERWKFMHHMKDVTGSPDEIWSTKDPRSGAIYKRYVKYYKGQPMVFSFPQENPDNWTAFASTVESTGKFDTLDETVRKGVLLYRK